ncbi:MAG: SCO family protein [Bacteroidetes bacterium]|nr:MAG: SCO family protein [Bacteroidota bacterium]TAG89969.1 MAG: SCO family protein [Bacteroidota bacterium]
MKNTKFLILFALLILPIFGFLFLQFFVTNHYKVTIYYPLDSTKVGNKWQVNQYHTLPDFNFTDQNNQSFGKKNLKDKLYIAEFFFTKCGNPTLCPKMSSELARVQEHFAKIPSVQIVSFTVDPENDTPEVLKNYSKKYNADTKQWHFLTGEKKQIYQLAYKGFKINAGEETTGVTPEFMHATKFILVDKQHRIRGYYDGTERESVDKLILETQILLREYKIQ